MSSMMTSFRFFQIDFDDCASNPCQHGGTCYDRSDRKNYETLRGLKRCKARRHRISTRPIFKHRIRYELSSGFYCKCRKGRLNEIALNRVLNNFLSLGVVGRRCEIDLCSNHRCPSNTHCVAFNSTTPACACNHGYQLDKITLKLVTIIIILLNIYL